VKQQLSTLGKPDYEAEAAEGSSGETFMVVVDPERGSIRVALSINKVTAKLTPRQARRIAVKLIEAAEVAES
jgi:hypothetical protein